MKQMKTGRSVGRPAGTSALGGPTVALSLSLKKSDYDRIAAAAEQHDSSVGAWIRRAVQQRFDLEDLNTL